jgi:hypothetical protein
MQDGKPTQFPILPGKGNYIKKVVIVESEDTKKRVQLREKAFAANDTVVRVDIYKKKDDDKLYFVPIYYYQLERERLLKKGNKINNVLYEIMWGQDENKDFIPNTKLLTVMRNQYRLPRFFFN